MRGQVSAAIDETSDTITVSFSFTDAADYADFICYLGKTTPNELPGANLPYEVWEPLADKAIDLNHDRWVES